MGDMLEAGIRATRRVVMGVRPGDLGKPTPCPAWDVQGLLDHLIGQANMFAAAARGEAYDPAVWGSGWASGDLLATYDKLMNGMHAAFGKSALDGTVELPIGNVPAQLAYQLASVDNVVHGWDLAKATGQDATIPAEIAEDILATARVAFGNFPRGEHLAPEVEVGADASPTDRLAAFMGRTP